MIADVQMRLRDDFDGFYRGMYIRDDIEKEYRDLTVRNGIAALILVFMDHRGGYRLRTRSS